jgi:hypothetical protein
VGGAKTACPVANRRKCGTIGAGSRVARPCFHDLLFSGLAGPPRASEVFSFKQLAAAADGDKKSATTVNTLQGAAPLACHAARRSLK